MRDYIPRPWQPPMLAHMAANPRCAIFAGMGSGKTSAVLTTVACAAELDEGPVLVLGPKRVANKTWPDEVRQWRHLQGLKIAAAIGTQTERFQALGKGADIVTINYDNLPWLVKHYGSKWPFRTVVADELTRLKGYRSRQGSVRAQALARVAHTHVKRFIGLTGTPAPNGLKDLWGQLWFVDRGERLGHTHEAFMQRWFQRSFGEHGVDPLPFAQEQIQERIADVCLSVNPADYLDIPQPIFNTVKVELPSKARSQYRLMEKEMFLQIREHEIEAVHAASRTIKCLQLANGAIYLDRECTQWEAIHDAKIEALESIIEEANGTPVLVAYHFRPDLIRLRKAFPQGRLFDADPRTEDEWNAGRIPVMFVHPQSAGHGSNLQYGGNILAFFGHWWNLEDRLQVIERIGPLRQFQSGLHRPVFIHDIVAENTVDEDVLVRHATKREVQDILLESMKRRAG